VECVADDGALFAFVVGTDPELLLLIEAQDDQWQYAVARLNRDAIEVLLDDAVIATWPHLGNELLDSTQPYFMMIASPAPDNEANSAAGIPGGAQ
jgi:hypothetical protein